MTSLQMWWDVVWTSAAKDAVQAAQVSRATDDVGSERWQYWQCIMYRLTVLLKVLCKVKELTAWFEE